MPNSKEYSVIITPWFWVSKFILLLCFIPLFAIGIVLFFGFDIEAGLIPLMQGIMWLIIALIPALKGLHRQRAFNILKDSGVCYKATVESITPSKGVHIGSYVTAKVHCIYQNNVGNRCLVKSGYHLLNPSDRNEDLLAKVYVNPQSPNIYIIELFRKSKKIQVDIDYT